MYIHTISHNDNENKYNTTNNSQNSNNNNNNNDNTSVLSISFLLFLCHRIPPLFRLGVAEAEAGSPAGLRRRGARGHRSPAGAAAAAAHGTLEGLHCWAPGQRNGKLGNSRFKVVKNMVSIDLCLMVTFPKVSKWVGKWLMIIVDRFGGIREWGFPTVRDVSREYSEWFPIRWCL